MKAALYFLFGTAAGFAAGWWGRPASPVSAGTVKVLTRIDTVRIIRPETIAVRELAPIEARLARAVADADSDSIEVAIPLQQNIYSTPDYRAYVSGYRPSLDSLILYRPTTSTLVSIPTPRKRFAVGISAGYALTPAGMQPYIGIGISLKLWEF